MRQGAAQREENKSESDSTDLGDELSRSLREMLQDSPTLPAERALSEQLGVSRYRLRRALTDLRSKGVAPPARKRASPGGMLTRHLSADTSPPELWEMRLAFEPGVARLAAVRATRADLQALRDAHALADPETFDLEADIAFHLAIAAASHNSLATAIVGMMTEMTREPGFRMQLPAMTSKTGWPHHEQILAAIAERRAVEAEAAMREHHTAIHRWLIGFPS